MSKQATTVRDTSIKKRRKTTANSDGDQEVDVYKVIVVSIFHYILCLFLHPYNKKWFHYFYRNQ